MEEVFRLQLNGYELRRSIVTNVREYPRLGIFGIGLCVCVPCLGTECLKALDGLKGALLLPPWSTFCAPCGRADSLALRNGPLCMETQSRTGFRRPESRSYVCACFAALSDQRPTLGHG